VEINDCLIGVLSRNLHRGLRETVKPFRIIVPDEIRTEYSPNAALKMYSLRRVVW
jgi:hypothetical protein